MTRTSPLRHVSGSYSTIEVHGLQSAWLMGHLWEVQGVQGASCPGAKGRAQVRVPRAPDRKSLNLARLRWPCAALQELFVAVYDPPQKLLVRDLSCAVLRCAALWPATALPIKL